MRKLTILAITLFTIYGCDSVPKRVAGERMVKVSEAAAEAEGKGFRSEGEGVISACRVETSSEGIIGRVSIYFRGKRCVVEYTTDGAWYDTQPK